MLALRAPTTDARVCVVACAALCLAAVACGPTPRVTLPTDAGVAAAGPASRPRQREPRLPRRAHAHRRTRRSAATPAQTRLRGRVIAGFERPASMRLEGVAPFGPPAFILVARGGDATLLLPRDERVVRGASPEDVLGALTGVALAPADLLAVLTGCVVPRSGAARRPPARQRLGVDRSGRRRDALPHARRRRLAAARGRAPGVGRAVLDVAGRLSRAACVLRSMSGAATSSCPRR